jgi:hypothetical protein
MAENVLYTVLDWGLGHATRSLPILRRLLSERFEVTIASRGRALALLRLELGDRCRYVSVPGVPTDWGRDYHWLFLLPKAYHLLRKTVEALSREHQFVERLVDDAGIDIVVADSCYGAHTAKVPSYLLAHNIKLHWFWRAEFLQRINEYVLSGRINQFKRILVPDFEEDSLTGSLAHDFRFVDANKVQYIGILSDLEREPREPDIDLFISITGTEPQRTSFEKQILGQIHDLNANVVVGLGRPEGYARQESQDRGVVIREFLTRSERNEISNRSRCIVSRCGYATVMDIVQLQMRRVVFVPTPNQTEQEYLADYYKASGRFYSVKQRHLNLVDDIQRAESYGGFNRNWSSKDSVSLFMDTVFG